MDKEREKIKAEYDNLYSDLISGLIEKNKKDLMIIALQELVIKHKQLNYLRMVQLFREGEEPQSLLMYELGNCVFFRFSRFYPNVGFYVGSGIGNIPGVQSIKDTEVEMDDFKNGILKYFDQGENKSKDTITINTGDDEHWVFRCKLKDSTEEDENVEDERIICEVAANNFTEASKKVMEKLSRLKDTFIFSDLELWWNGSFRKIISAKKTFKDVYILINSINSSDMVPSQFNFIIS